MSNLKFVGFMVTFACCCFVDATKADAINDYLVSNGAGDDLDSNIAAAKKWLIIKEQKKSSFFSGNANLLENLRTFISMEDIVKGTERCNGKSYGILLANNRLVPDLNRKIDTKDKSLTRHESIVYQVMKNHADNCYQVYPEKYNKSKEGADREQIELAEGVMKESAKLHEVTSLAWLEEEDVRRVYTSMVELAKMRNDPEVLYAYLQNSESTGKGSIKVEKLASLYERYVERPCKYYANDLGKEIFKPAMLDMIFNKTRDKLGGLYQIYNGCEKINADTKKEFFAKIMNYIVSMRKYS